MLLNLDYRLFWDFISFIFSFNYPALLCLLNSKTFCTKWCTWMMPSWDVICSDTQTGWLLSSEHGLYGICLNRTVLCIFQNIYAILSSNTTWVTGQIFLLPRVKNAMWKFLFTFILFVSYKQTNVALLTEVVFYLFFPDCELFVFEILQDENISIPAQEAREILLRNFHVIQKRWGMSQYVLFMRSY